MCTYSLNDIFFNFDEQVVDKCIYCYVEEYCAVFWSVTSGSCTLAVRASALECLRRHVEGFRYLEYKSL